ncbi:YybH family protein [Indioceanicola profundi]|uniref:YybH family protein n=1 Tax=Indioceanicola profundi TaxID=2220096 RepID=UPI000E6ACD4F|nr:hypothetical protein [Indioceanicola profundi]
MRAILTAAAVAVSATLPFSPPAAADDAAAALLEADRAFNAMAQEKGVGPAFAAFAEPAVQMLNLPSPDLKRDDLPKLFPPGYHLIWEPQDGRISADGTFGYTWGGATIRSTGPDGTVREQPSRYITVWRLQADGSWKWIADGGLAMPPAKKP